MKKIICVLLIFISKISLAQVYEAGLSYNVGQIFGEDKNVGPPFGNNFGITLKKNMHPRISYRIAAAKLNSNQTKLTEISAGIDFNFSKYNLVRANGLDKSTPYIIMELTGLFYDNGVDANKFTMAIPMGVGYKTSISNHFTAAIEAKGRVAFTDKLDSGVTNPAATNYVKQNKTTLDAYYYIGASIYYTFGWPRGSKNQTRF